MRDVLVTRQGSNRERGGGGGERETETETERDTDDDELMLNVLRCHLTY